MILWGLLTWFSLCSGCGDDCGATHLLQHRVARGPTRFSASACVSTPELCREPFDCLNTTGTLYSYERARQRVAEHGANLQSWCYISERDVIPLISECVVHQNLQAYAQGQFQRSLRLHPLDDLDASYCFIAGLCQDHLVTPNTTLAQAEAICDERYPSWRTIGFKESNKHYPRSHWEASQASQARKGALFACAMGVYQCDVVNCRENYCDAEPYKRRFQHLAPR